MEAAFLLTQSNPEGLVGASSPTTDGKHSQLGRGNLQLELEVKC